MTRYQHHGRAELRAAPAAVWAHATSLAGINTELAPLLRMTAPPGIETLDETTVRPGQPLGRSGLLLFGFLPIDRMDLMLIEFEPGRRFVERSNVRSMRLWQHERTIEPSAGGCVLTDALTFEPRFGGPLVAAFMRWVFVRRHRTLHRLFG